MKYAYARVSTDKQSVDRQVYELKEYVEETFIYIDKESGKDFNRHNYQKLKKALKKGDELYIKSIDRLGRNYDLITDEFRQLSKNIGVIIYILDMPFINTFNDTILDDSLRTFIIDIVLQILSFVAENERINIKNRQKEGIKIAKLNGKHLGRPALILPNSFVDIIKQVKDKTLSVSNAIKLLNISKTSYYKYLKIYQSWKNMIVFFNI